LGVQQSDLDACTSAHKSYLGGHVSPYRRIDVDVLHHKNQTGLNVFLHVGF
jgi:hypothetical protein